jgi:CBS domain-containing protein
MLVKDGMRSNAAAIHSEATLREAAEMMMTCGVDALFVIQDGQLVGIVGLRDLFTAPLPAHYGGRMVGHRNEGQLLATWASMPVLNVMNIQVISVSEQTELMRAAELMVNSGKHPLPVLRDGGLVGTIDRADIVRVLLASRAALGQASPEEPAEPTSRI